MSGLGEVMTWAPGTGPLLSLVVVVVVVVVVDVWGLEALIKIPPLFRRLEGRAN